MIKLYYVKRTAEDKKKTLISTYKTMKEYNVP